MVEVGYTHDMKKYFGVTKSLIIHTVMAASNETVADIIAERLENGDTVAEQYLTEQELDALPLE